MARRWMFALAALLVAAAGAVVWLGDDSSARAVEPAAGAVDEETSTVAWRELAPLERDRAEAGVREEPATPSRATPAPAEAGEVEEARTVAVHGTAVVVDPTGAEHVAESGDMKLSASRDGYGSRVDVRVADGTWSADVPEGARLTVSSATLGDRVAFWEGSWDESLAIPESGFVALRFRWPPASVLVVRAADTGLELDELEVVSNFWYPDGDGAHPGRVRAEHAVARGVRSPIELETEVGPWNASKDFFVRRPGYAWGKIEVDLSRGGERLLELVPGGDVLVSFTRHEPAAGALLVLTGEGGEVPLLELPLDGEGDEVRIESLPAGTFRLAVQLGHWFENTVSLGAGTVDVVAGTETSVVVPLEPGPELVLAPLSGRLVIPAGWDIEVPYLSFDLAGPAYGGREDHFALYARDLRAVPGEPGVYEWEVAEAQVGAYEISVSDPPVSVRVELGPEGRSGVLVELPPAARVRLKVFEKETGQVADVAKITWHPVRELGVGGSSSVVSRDDATGAFEFTATVGAIEISPWGHEFGLVREDYHLEPGLNELVLLVTRAPGVLVVLKDGDTIVPWDHTWNVRPERVDGPPGGWGVSWSAEGTRFTAPESGLYRLVFPELPGYVAVEPLEVWLGPEVRETLEVSLVRKR